MAKQGQQTPNRADGRKRALCGRLGMVTGTGSMRRRAVLGRASGEAAPGMGRYGSLWLGLIGLPLV